MRKCPVAHHTHTWIICVPATMESAHEEDETEEAGTVVEMRSAVEVKWVVPLQVEEGETDDVTAVQ